MSVPEVLPDELELDEDMFDEFDTDDMDNNQKDVGKWMFDYKRDIGVSKVGKGNLLGKKMLSWDVVPLCYLAIQKRKEKEITELEAEIKKTTSKAIVDLKDRLKQLKTEFDEFTMNMERCPLGEKAQCYYLPINNKKRTPTCMVLMKIMDPIRAELYNTYMDLDQDSFNQIGLELLPLYMLLHRINIQVTALPLIIATKTGSKANPLLKEQRSTTQAIQNIRTILDYKLAVVRKEIEPGGVVEPPKSPMQGM